MNVNEVRHWVIVTVKTKKGGELVESLQWQELRWHTRCSFDWYFKYRAALLQIKYPRYEVDMRWGNNSKPKSEFEKLQDKITGKKATITKYKNLLKKAEDSWTDLFPITTNPDYNKAVEKIKRLEFELGFLIQSRNEYQKADL
ncbi:hypothetical protein [Mongoliitalea daihaiensis]|uniref:hypothetical protein n=1 Tax=Mongoliitalea daihaiensis TaxID=2782006 RepID=UPI001F421182|nr:hypothetical protein [Mongoliitalea daihaiensis]UJP63972.1 hypothetical protein IPZ59_14230 [Mongoliitalea daihaiensis]